MVDLYSRTYNIYIYRERERKRERLIYRTTRTDQGSGRRLIVTSHLVSPIRLDNIGEHHNEYVFRGKNPSIRGFERAPLEGVLQEALSWHPFGSEFC
jgi:hypothetical protein